MRNEAGWIESCLASVFAQDYPADRMEVIVVDGMSNDGSVEILRRMAATEPRLKVLDNPARIVPVALNLAIRCARGEVIARMDAHTVLAEDYLSTGVELLASSGADNVGGPMRTIGGGPIGDAVACAMGSRFGIGAEFHFAEDEREVDTVYMGMWPRSVFERVGLFDEELVRNQDDEFNYRLRKAGGRILLSPALRSRYQNRQTWRGLIKQFYQYGFWKVRVLQKHPLQLSIRHFVPPLFDFAVILSLVLAPVSAVAARVAATAIGGYVLCMALVAGRLGASMAGRAMVLGALSVIHHAWGLGYLAGLVRFAGRWFKSGPEVEKLSAQGGPEQRAV